MDTHEPADPAQSASMTAPTRIVDLLAEGEAVFGIFSGDHTAEQGVAMGQNLETDFVFYSLESGPFDIPSMVVYMDGLQSVADANGPHPVALRIPPIRDGHSEARSRAAEGLAAGVAALVFPHVQNAEDAALAVATVGEHGWPSDPRGRKTNILIIEDKEAIPSARAIASTPGVGVVIPGPGDLSRSFDGDMEAVESAIQEVLGVCLDVGVICGITAGVNDIEARLEQGFRLIIVTEPEALAVGRAAAGRTE